VLGDVLEYEYDFKNTSLIFANCKTFDKELMMNISSKLKDIPDGVILITTVQAMSEFDGSWIIIDKLRRVMSWGSATIYIQVKQSV
jgi:hypothetical protein